MVFIYYTAITLFVLLCLLLCSVIMMQESQQQGLGSSFGGGGDVSDSLFGTATADVLKKFTAWMAFAFLGACVLMSIWTQAMGPKVHRTPTTIEQVG